VISSGVRLIPVILGLTITQIVIGGLIAATGIHNPFLILGPAIAAVGSGLFMLLDDQSSTGQWIGFQIVLGVGVGLCLTIPLMLSQVVVDAKDVSTATPIIICEFSSCHTIGSLAKIIPSCAINGQRFLTSHSTSSFPERAHEVAASICPRH
jgi:hypothetical protein